MNAQEFVNLLKDLNVLAAGTIEGLLNQSDVVSDKRTPQQLLKSLLDSGQITREQARLVVSKVQQLEAQALTADDEVIDLSQANLSGDVERVAGANAVAITLLGESARAAGVALPKGRSGCRRQDRQDRKLSPELSNLH